MSKLSKFIQTEQIFDASDLLLAEVFGIIKSLSRARNDKAIWIGGLIFC